MACGTRFVTLVWLAFAFGTVSCGSDAAPQGGGGAGSGSAGSGSAGSGSAGSGGVSPPSRGPTGDAGTGIVVVGGSGGAAGAAGAPGGAGGGGGGEPSIACPDGVRGNDIPCDATTDLVCLSDCLNGSRIRCGCTDRGMGSDRWVCGGQPMDCQ